MRTLLKASLIAVSLPALSGCQSFPLTSWMFKRPAPAVAPMVDRETALALEEGRAALRANRPVEAITPLRIARLDPELRAQADNALGVAYAQLGRDDLAEGFFKAAIAAEPGDTRFSDNLFRLQSAMLARRAKADEARLAQAPATAPTGGFVLGDMPVQARAEPADSARVAGTAQRISRSEVFIASANAGSAPTASVAFAARPKDKLDAARSAPAPVKVASAPAAEPIAFRVVSQPIRVRLLDNPPAPAVEEQRP